MIEVKVVARLNNGNTILTAIDVVNSEQAAYYSVQGFVTWFTSVYAKGDLEQVMQKVGSVSVKSDWNSRSVFKYSSDNIELQVRLKKVK